MASRRRRQSSGFQGENPYDIVPYPSAIFRQAQPDRMALVARLHGLTPSPAETTRYLDIGGGDGLNAIALATAFPDAEFVNFDLAPTAVARGERWTQTTGLTNVRHEVLDILEAADRLEGSFDYIVAHGVYAWVPDHVRAAIFPLIARLLSPNGVAMVSYNAMPGGYSRLALRGLLLRSLPDGQTPVERAATARAFLAEFAEPVEHDEPILQSMRREAEAMLGRPDEVLLHDEMGDFYNPQAMADVAADAAANGLAYLSDAGKNLVGAGFWAAEETPGDEAALVRRIQAQDFVQGRYFRNSLFVRAGSAPARIFDPNRLRSLWVSGFLTEKEPNLFSGGDVTVELRDAVLAGALRTIARHFPSRVAVDTLFDDPDHLEALFRLAIEGMVDLHTVPAPFVLDPGTHPTASPLVRMQLAQGLPLIAALDHRTVEMEDPRAIAFIALLDGSRDRAALERDWQASGYADQVSTEMALALVARAAILAA